MRRLASGVLVAAVFAVLCGAATATTLTLHVDAVTIAGDQLVATVTVPGRGTTVLTGTTGSSKALEATGHPVRWAGAVTLRAPLTAAGFRALDTGRLRICVAVRHTSAAGVVQTTARTFTLARSSNPVPVTG